MSITRVKRPKWTMAFAILAVLLVGPVVVAQTSMHNVQWIEGGVPDGKVPGAAAAVVRDAGGVSVVINTRHLQPGPVTLWLFFFTCDPSGCSPDSTNGMPMFATADIIEANGKGNLAAGVPISSSFLTDPLTDEIHAVIVDGKPGGTPLWEQLTSPADGTFRQVVVAVAE